MFCSTCGQQAKDHSRYCDQCGASLARGAQPASSTATAGLTRPIAGIVLALVFAGLGAIWAIVGCLGALSTSPGGVQGQLYKAFPGLDGLHLLGYLASIVGNAAVLVGASLTLASHPAGPKTTRIACWSLIGVAVLGSLLTLTLFTSAPAWLSMNAPTKGGLIGGLVGGVVGAIAQWGLVLFLFRRAAPSTPNQPMQRTGGQAARR